jgi:hypothetical protein
MLFSSLSQNTQLTFEDVLKLIQDIHIIVINDNNDTKKNKITEKIFDINKKYKDKLLK